MFLFRSAYLLPPANLKALIAPPCSTNMYTPKQQRSFPPTERPHYLRRFDGRRKKKKREKTAMAPIMALGLPLPLKKNGPDNFHGQCHTHSSMDWALSTFWTCCVSQVHTVCSAVILYYLTPTIRPTLLVRFQTSPWNSQGLSPNFSHTEKTPTWFG